MATDVSDPLALLRRELGDDELPYLWGDDDLTQYLDEGQEAFARTTELFTDATTPSITRVTVTAGEPFVARSPKIHRILSGYLQTAQAEVMAVNLNELYRLYWGDDYGNHNGNGRWRVASGTPRYIVLDIEQDKGRLLPIPTQSDVLELTVVRLPLQSIADAGTLEVSNALHLRAILAYAKGLAYDKNDIDTQDSSLATQFKAEALQAMFAIREETKRLRRRPGTVAYGGL